MLMDKIMHLEVASYSLFLFQKSIFLVFFCQTWAVNKSCSEADSLWMLQKVKWSLYASIFRLLVFFWRFWPPRNACKKKTSFMMAFLSLPDSSAVLMYWGKCTYVASINTNALRSSIGEYKPVGLGVIVCLTGNYCQGKQIFEKAYLN